MKHSIFILLIFSFSLLVYTSSPVVMVSANTVPDASKSSIFLTGNPTAVNPSTQVIIYVNARNSTNNPITGADVNIVPTDGQLLTSSVGTTNSTGYFNATWKSPAVSFSIPSLNVHFNASIFSNGTTIFVLTSVTVKHLDNSAIKNSQLLLSTSVESNSSTIFPVQVLDASNNPTQNMQVTFMSTGDGEFTPTPQPQGLTNSHGFFNATWQAPSLTKEKPQVNVTISVLVQASDTINITIQKDVTVVFTIGSLDVNISLNATALDQTAILLSTITVKDHTTHLPVSNADVYLTAELGVFLSSNNPTYHGVTNSNGQISVEYSAVDSQLIVQLQNVSITYLVSNPKYNDSTGSFSFLINKKASTYQFSSLPSSDLIQFGENVTFLLTAKRNSLYWANATFKITATGGSFSNGNEIFSAKTNNSGILEVVWNSGILVPSIDQQTIYFEIQLINSGLSSITQYVNVSFEHYTTTLPNTVPSQSDFISQNIIPITGSAVIIILGVIGTVIAIRKLRK